ncbi:uncharacterized protein CCOS01_07813, partial [Colletotrichum costaricense]
TLRIRNTPSSQQGNTSSPDRIASELLARHVLVDNTTPHSHLPVPIPPVTILHPADPSFNLPSSPRLPPDFETFRCPIDRTNMSVGPGARVYTQRFSESLDRPANQRCI